MKILGESVWLAIAAFLLNFYCAPLPAAAQEKKLVRMISPSFSWNSDLVFRVAKMRGYFKAEGIMVESILIRGGAVATAALTGALIVGDSLRGSLAARATAQRGGFDSALVTNRFVHQEIAAKLPGTVTAALLLPGSVRQADDAAPRLGRVAVLAGVAPSEPTAGQCWLSARLARDLQLGVGMTGVNNVQQ